MSDRKEKILKTISQLQKELQKLELEKLELSENSSENYEESLIYTYRFTEDLYDVDFGYTGLMTLEEIKSECNYQTEEIRYKRNDTVEFLKHYDSYYDFTFDEWWDPISGYIDIESIIGEYKLELINTRPINEKDKILIKQNHILGSV